MRTVILGPRPVEIDALIARRHELGLDLLDEVWEGDYHMNAAPAGPHSWIDQQLAEILGPMARAAGLYCSDIFNLGVPDNFRVPDRGVHRERPLATWYPTAAIVVEVESPGDETWEKFDFYAAHGVDEVLVVAPGKRTVSWWALVGDRYEGRPASALLGPASEALADRIEWP